MARPTRPTPSTQASTTAPARPSATPAAANELVLIADGEASWLEVQTQDGETLFRGNLEGRRSFPIGSGLRVLAGRPDLVQVQYGGASPAAMGTISDVRPRIYEPAPPSAGANTAVEVTPPAP